MLLFSAPPVDVAGQPLLPDMVVFPDHLPNHVLYYLPTNLTLLRDSKGAPDFFLLRYHGDNAEAQGGLLRFRLGFAPLPDVVLQSVSSQGWQPQEVGFAAARFRLRLRSWLEGELDQLGEWHETSTNDGEWVASALSLNAHETQFLEALLSDRRNALEIELELHYVGLTKGLPWLASADSTRLRSLLAALLPTEDFSVEQIVAAFLSLPVLTGEEPLIGWQALEPGAVRPSDELLLREIAFRSLDRLFDRQPTLDPFAQPTYRLRAAAEGDPFVLSWDILLPRQESRSYLVTWSVQSLLQSLETPEAIEQLFPVIAQVSPFAKVDIHLVNRLPFDPHYLRKVVVDLRYSGASGVPEFHSFTFDGSSEIQRFSAFYPAVVAAFQLAARFTTTLAPPSGSGWPIVRRGDFVAISGSLVEVNRANVGMEFVRVEVEPAIFAKATAITLELFTNDPTQETTSEALPTPACQLRLTSSQPAASLALSGVKTTDVLFVRTTAHTLADATPLAYTLYIGELKNRHVRIAAYQLEVLEPDRVIIELDPGLTTRFAFITVTVAALSDEGRSYALQIDQPVVWSLFRNSVFDSLVYRYRLDYVALDEEGQTLPLVSTDWTTSHTPHLIIQP